jgi:hypothetical protein
MYQQSWESAPACVLKYIRAQLPSQAPRAGLPSETRTLYAARRFVAYPRERVSEPCPGEEGLSFSKIYFNVTIRDTSIDIVTRLWGG